MDAVGNAVAGFAPGDQVALYYITAPPSDPWAAGGRPNISPYVTRIGVDVDGAFADGDSCPTISAMLWTCTSTGRSPSSTWSDTCVRSRRRMKRLTTSTQAGSFAPC